LTRLTDFSRLLARHASRLGLVDHKWSITTSGGLEKPAFGGPNPSIWCVASLARYTVSRCAPRCTRPPAVKDGFGHGLKSFWLGDEKLGLTKRVRLTV